jgi:pimeloyl-ACP methyl ester carboxylesterase
VPSVRTPILEIGYEEHGPASGPPVILLHGFPDDVHAWDGATGPLAAAGCRVLVPYLRGYGPTRFLDETAPRMAQQAAIGQDLLDFMHALGLERVSLAGYDWGGRAACLAAILAPSRVRALVTIGGYNVQNTLASPRPAGAEDGRVGLEQNRREICRLLWRDWSPGWRFDDATFERTAVAFDNPDFVPVVIHSYRHRHRNAPGDPRFDGVERRLAERPPITVPTVILHGRDDGVDRPQKSEAHLAQFPAGTERRVVPDAGHFLPREQPGAVVEALLALLSRTR